MIKDRYERHLDPEEPYYWRDSHGNLFQPKDMPTRHLWFTLRMLWNHLVPEEDRLSPYKEHAGLLTNKSYPMEYLNRSVQELSKELHTRRDMEPLWAEEFQKIQNP